MADAALKVDVNFMQSITKQNGHVSDFVVYEE